MRILVVDDEPAVREAVDRALRLEGYDTELAADGAEALDALALRAPDALVLDVLMPEVDGLEVCRRLRAAGDHTPVLVLTARDAVPDRVRGLDAGADDYLVKPFALEELLARLRALLRRSGGPGGGETLRFDDVELEPQAHTVRRGRRPVELTRTEFLLLELFLRHPRQVLTRSQIFERVWGYDFGPASNSLEVYVGYLRRKLEAGGEPRIIQTVRGVGYVLR
ncbi:MAG TPA: response regulator transcription factor [Solirubrobacteraceae bacterium]|nr:response regulator transcription factor [Solirubrobacteraceae bacterium]